MSGKQLAICGLVFQLGPLVGIAVTAAGMMKTFKDLAGNRTPRPEELAEGINLALYATIAGMGLSLLGAVLLLIALAGARYRAPWFKTVMWIISVLWLFNVPLGTVLGLVVMVYLSNHKDEFRQAQK